MWVSTIKLIMIPFAILNFLCLLFRCNYVRHCNVVFLKSNILPLRMVTTNYTSYYYSFSYSLYFSTTSPPAPSLTPGDIVFGVITFLLITFGIPANVISLLYFMKKSGSTASTMIYRLMNIVDLGIALLLIPIGVNYFHTGRKTQPYMFGNNVFCNLWSVLWHVLIRLSIYLIGVMSTARAISLIKPLYFLPKSFIIRPFICYTVFLHVQQTLPYWFKEKDGVHIVRYFHLNGICTWTFGEIFEMFSNHHKICDFFFIQLEFLLPVIPIVLSSVISIIKLHDKKNRDVGRNSSNRNYNRKHATVTIIILTITFVLLNTPFLIYQLFQSIMVLSNGRLTIQWNKSLSMSVNKTMALVSNIHLIALNSCLNPIVYFTRIKELRRHVLSPNGWTKINRTSSINFMRKRSIRLSNRKTESSRNSQPSRLSDCQQNGLQNDKTVYLQLKNIPN